MRDRIVDTEALVQGADHGRGFEDHSSDLWAGYNAEAARDLLNAAVHCFARNGYHATTTRDISVRAGLSPAALYVHFSSKEQVLFEIIGTAHKRALEEVARGSHGAGGDPGDQLAELMVRYTAWHARHHVAARVAQLELGGLTDDHYEQVVALRRQTTDIFREVVTRGMRDGSFAAGDVASIVRAMLSLSIDLVRWYRMEADVAPERIAALYAALALRMVGAEAPQPTTSAE